MERHAFRLEPLSERLPRVGGAMIEPRIYRAAFIPVLFVIVLVAFSLESTPGPLPAGLGANALFDSGQTTAQIGQLVRATPDRRAGTAGDAAVAAQVQTSFEQAGFPTATDRFTAGGHLLTNVVARRPGDSPREIVIAAGRDARGIPDAATSAADTAALLELANLFKGTAVHHTLVLASLDGATLGDAGARRFAATLPDASQVDAVVVLSHLGASRSRGPLVLGYSDDLRRGSIALERTASASLAQEFGQLPPPDGFAGQFAHLAFPLAPGAQGVFQRAGLEAVAISGSGELAPPLDALPSSGSDRIGALGRGALRLVGALDAASGRPPHGPKTYLLVAGRALPGWAITALAVALMFPALAASIDAFARARRRREPVGRWFVWAGGAALAFAMGYSCGLVFVHTPLGPDAPSAPLDPVSAKIDAATVATLAISLVGTAVAWVVVRTALIRRAGPLPAPDAPGAGAAAALILSAMGMAAALFNPYAALVLALAVNLWVLVALTEAPARFGALLVALGLVPLGALAGYDLWHLSLDPVHGALYLLLLVMGGQVAFAMTLGGAVLLGSGASLIAILRARGRAGRDGYQVPHAARGGRISGPAGHAGPGALGGPGSAVRR